MNRKIITVIAVFSAVVFFVSGSSVAGFFGHHKKIKDKGGELLIPISKVNDGEAHYYVYSDKGQEVKFFVVKSTDGVIRAAFDACDVCFRSKKGYTQAGEFMICNNCGRKFHSNRINIVKGGCNPAPLNRTERGDHLVITVKDVLEGARYF